MLYLHRDASPLGEMTLASDGAALTGLWFDGQRPPLDLSKAREAEELLPVFARTLCWLDIYFSGRAPDFTPPLRLSGTVFRETVWDLLLTVPYGKTVTYGELARLAAARLGLARMSAQAVGGAVGANPVSIIVPCHRVLGADGSLTGYAGGLDCKRFLLELERSGNRSMAPSGTSSPAPGRGSASGPR